MSCLHPGYKRARFWNKEPRFCFCFCFVLFPCFCFGFVRFCWFLYFVLFCLLVWVFVCLFVFCLIVFLAFFLLFLLNVHKLHKNCTALLHVSNRGYQIGIKLKTNIPGEQPAEFTRYVSSPLSYVAAELLKEDIIANPEFVIGDNKTYGSYHNPPLKYTATYLIYVGLISRIDKTVS